jgi:hypothetical protein
VDNNGGDTDDLTQPYGTSSLYVSARLFNGDRARRMKSAIATSLGLIRLSEIWGRGELLGTHAQTWPLGDLGPRRVGANQNPSWHAEVRHRNGIPSLLYTKPPSQPCNQHELPFLRDVFVHQPRAESQNGYGRIATHSVLSSSVAASVALPGSHTQSNLATRILAHPAF